MSRLVLNKSGQWVKSIPKPSHKSVYIIPPSIIKTTTLPSTSSTSPVSNSKEPEPEPPITTTSLSPPPPSSIVEPIPTPPSPSPSPPPSPIIKPSPILPPVKSIRGIQIPIRPPPPSSEECCMSGCHFCIYDIYLSTLEEYQERLGYTRKALLALRGPKLEKGLWPKEELGEYPEEIEVGDEGGGKGKGKGGKIKNLTPEERAKKDLDLVMKGLDPSIRAFLEMEARLKKKRLDREAEEKKLTSKV